MVFPLRVALSIERADAAPGDDVTFDVTIRNTSDIVEHYDIDVLGLPAGAAATAQPAAAKLRPGESATSTVRLAVGADCVAAAGRYTLGVLVRSRYRAEASRCEELQLDLAAVQDVAVRIEPEVATGGRDAQYTVEVINGGNLPVRLALSAADPERRVTARFQPSVVDIPRTATGYAYLTVSAPVPWSGEKHRALTVEATGSGVRATGTATFVQRPRVAPRLLQTAGMVGAVLLLAGAVVGGALIARGNDQKADPVGATGQPPATAPTTPAPAPVPEQTVPSPTPAASSPPPATTGPAGQASDAGQESAAAQGGQPRVVDLTRPFGAPANGPLPSDAFRDDGLLLAGAPEADTPAECAEATSVAVEGDNINGRSLSASLPDGGFDCSFVPVQIRPLTPVTTFEVKVAGTGRRQMEVFYRDLSRSVESDLSVTDDGSRGGIDFVVVRGVAAQSGDQAPATQLTEVRYTPAQ